MTESGGLISLTVFFVYFICIRGIHENRYIDKSYPIDEI
ncbi:hypothetical protein J2S17_004413 [Cytobacillus purgationiresistens]|uniref:Uncharacterized protein n=1 Tax=Cytobacillus purgationiresistens TaxID=863449 RepID=A0ABU0AMP2_9BACI|nr:hypothetical protein [Cytobacillus purgationiresistens]